MVFQRPETPPETVAESSLPWKRDPDAISSLEDTPQLAHEPMMPLHFLSLMSEDSSSPTNPDNAVIEELVLKDSRHNKICNLSSVIEEEPEDVNCSTHLAINGEEQKNHCLPWREEPASNYSQPDCQTPINHTAPSFDHLKSTSSTPSHSIVTAGGDSDICESDRSSISKHQNQTTISTNLPIVRKQSVPNRASWRFDDSEQPLTSPMCSDILSISDRDTISHRAGRIKRLDSRSELTSIVSSAASLRRRHSFIMQQSDPVNIFENDQSVEILCKTMEERMFEWLESVNPDDPVDEEERSSQMGVVIDLGYDNEPQKPNVTYA